MPAEAVQSQLDKARTAMTLKAHNLNMPLTFAIKDVTLDLLAHVVEACPPRRSRADVVWQPSGTKAGRQIRG